MNFHPAVAKHSVSYRGYYYDDETGLYYLKSRYYDPELGRFISPDDVGYLGANGDLVSYNLYAYCSNNPVMYADPSGHFVISLSAFLIGIAIGAGIGAGISFGATVYQDYSDDGEVFNGSIGVDEYIGNTAGGLIAGAGVGAAMVAGESLTLGGMALSGSAALGIGASAAFVTGGLGYTARTTISSKETFQVSDMLIEAGANTASGMISFAGGMVGGITGVKIPGVKNGVANFLKYHGGLTYFGAYPTKFLISKIRIGLQERYE